MSNDNRADEPTGILMGKADKARIATQNKGRLHGFVLTWSVMKSMPHDEMPREVAAGFVKEDIRVLRTIHDARTRQLALNSMAESGFAQQHYQAEVARQAPDLVEATKAANAAIVAEHGADYQPVAAAQASMRGRGRH